MTISWTQIPAEQQKAVIDTLNEFALQFSDQNLSIAYQSAAKELALWIEEAVANLFTIWMSDHFEVIQPYAGQAIAVNVQENKVVLTGSMDSFWDGSFGMEVERQFPNNSNVYITNVSNHWTKETVGE